MTLGADCEHPLTSQLPVGITPPMSPDVVGVVFFLYPYIFIIIFSFL